MHLIRCPEAQIASVSTHSLKSREFIQTHMLLQAYTGFHNDTSVNNNQFILQENEETISKFQPLLGMKTTPENSLWLDRNYSTFFRERVNVVSNKVYGISHCSLSLLRSTFIGLDQITTS